jgi:hypothetical protein
MMMNEWLRIGVKGLQEPAACIIGSGVRYPDCIFDLLPTYLCLYIHEISTFLVENLARSLTSSPKNQQFFDGLSQHSAYEVGSLHWHSVGSAYLFTR